MPRLDEEAALAGLKKLLEVEADWVPRAPGASLYIRPAMIALDAQLGVHAAKRYLFFIILSPVGSYYPQGFQPVGIYVEDEYVRAVRGGRGLHQMRRATTPRPSWAGEIAAKKGYSQVLWLDGVEQRYVEEVGSMNMMFAYGRRIVTPALNGSILPGITRDSVLTLAHRLGYEAVETHLAIDELFGRRKGRAADRGLRHRNGGGYLPGRPPLLAGRGRHHRRRTGRAGRPQPLRNADGHPVRPRSG